MRWILACVVCVLIALIFEQCHAREQPLPPDLVRAEQAAPPRAAPPVALEAVRPAPREEAAPAAAPPPTPQAAEPEDLLGLLRRIALAYSAQDAAALEPVLESLLHSPTRCEEALLLLEKGGLKKDELACAGAVFGIGTAFTCYSGPDRPAGIDGRAFNEGVLEALADVQPPEQQDLAQQLIEAKIDEKYLLDLSYLGKILELRTRHPDQAEVYSGLLVHMAEGLGDAGGIEEFRALFLTEGQDPTAVKLSLAALLRADAASWLPLAEDLFADAAGKPALRSAIAFAIATAAPVELAAASLARLAHGGMYTEFSLLGMREGGAEALAARYNELVSSGGNPLARRMLVSGLRSESEPVLVGIARTDSDPSVRTQALLTSSLGRPSGPELLAELETLHGLRSDPAHGISTGHAVLVAGNVLVNSAEPERERAKDLLLRIASDPAESDLDRLNAARTLKPWMPPGTFANWVIGGQKVE